MPPLSDTHYQDMPTILSVGSDGRGGPRSIKAARWTRDQGGGGYGCMSEYLICTRVLDREKPRK
jgi:hypothetical protein